VVVVNVEVAVEVGDGSGGWRFWGKRGNIVIVMGYPDAEFLGVEVVGC